MDMSLDEQILLKKLLTDVVDENFGEFKDHEFDVNAWDMGGGIHFMGCFFRCRWRRDGDEVSLYFQVRSTLDRGREDFELGEVLLAEPDCNKKIVEFIRIGVLKCFRRDLLLWRFFKKFDDGVV